MLRAMLFYVDEFPERLHHTKESSLLFPRLRERARAGTRAVAAGHEHARGEATVREVEHALLAFEVLGEPRRAAFEHAVERYVSEYLEHMAIEETEVLPAAQRLLTAADWSELDTAFAANRDPLTGHEPADEYRELFHTNRPQRAGADRAGRRQPAGSDAPVGALLRRLASAARRLVRRIAHCVGAHRAEFSKVSARSCCQGALLRSMSPASGGR
ncbi:MAG: hemerythrin domain-containing protein [Rubrivivax sp.]